MNINITSIIPTYFTPASSEVWSKDFELIADGKYLMKAASGSGKSSFFNFLYGLNNKYAGTILFDATDISSYTEIDWTALRREKVSIVFQGLRLFPELTALENIQLKNQLTNYKTETEILAYMKQLNVVELAHKKAETLSYGQQQRVAIVRALCQPFELLLLDEPFSHIDDAQIVNATQLITEEVAKRKATLIIASLGNSYDIDYTKTFLL
ncbi:ATP-binding cassette domain-containing protein [Kordia sp. YSTF-M3]|uniref:ATP-binding cassette domain-containing protein n=1 Tax=Kordia aestuariivivens TaxID=2759037 RepID=A0ABR7QBR6_9FLAO|nr:ATP-binding cassette domain-containing protein [Kordia aestuariivivens]MBC8756015.1 ATP-binding cassette domain-containing protein [Kordia aestuariivivens]